MKELKRLKDCLKPYYTSKKQVIMTLLFQTFCAIEAKEIYLIVCTHYRIQEYQSPYAY